MLILPILERLNSLLPHYETGYIACYYIVEQAGK
jgi:hypothetical protein